MISRRNFMKGVATGTLIAPFLGVSQLPGLLHSADHIRYIPGWSRKVTCLWTEQDFPFVDFFKKNYLIRHHDYPFGTPFKAVHQNLYESPLCAKNLNGDIHLFVISAHLEDINCIEKIYQHESNIQRAEMSWCFFTLPKNSGGIKSVLNDKRFIQQLDRIPCSIVLIDDLAIQRTVPKLPHVDLNGSNRDRILQTAICGIVEPVVSIGMIGIDFADLRALRDHGKLFGMGVGFIDMSEDLDETADKAFSSICSQIGMEKSFNNSTNACWGNVSGNHKMTMDHLQSLMERLHGICHEDAYIIASYTVDNGLEDYVMQTCYLGLS